MKVKPDEFSELRQTYGDYRSANFIRGSVRPPNGIIGERSSQRGRIGGIVVFGCRRFFRYGKKGDNLTKPPRRLVVFLGEDEIKQSMCEVFSNIQFNSLNSKFVQ